MKISCSFLWQEIWSGRYIRDVLYFRICSVLEELFYIKGKVHENTIFQMQARQRKFICYMSCTFPYLSKLRKCQFWSSAFCVLSWSSNLAACNYTPCLVYLPKYRKTMENFVFALYTVSAENTNYKHIQRTHF